jgi:competence protein CoiA
MLVAKRVSEAESRELGPWQCPSCADRVSIKKGQIKIHHFAHTPPVRCEYGAGESEAHRECKTAIYETLRALPGARDWELERDFGTVRPDVSGYIGEQPLAIEVQISSLTLDQIAHRTREYASKQIPILWVGLWRPSLAEKRIAPSAWERWLHTLYFGRVYYWRQAATVTPVHFDDHYLWVEEREWREDGEDCSAGGYHRRSKRWREPRPGKTISIQEMSAAPRDAWSGGDMRIPACLLSMDRQPRWWAK